jgi:hypothetical protein
LRPIGTRPVRSRFDFLFRCASIRKDIMNATRFTPLLLALALAGPVVAQETEHRLGDHPAVIVKRLADQQGYDYEAKFYPHPAWLYLSTEAPRPVTDHPAVIAAKRQAEWQAGQTTVQASAPEKSTPWHN